MYAAARYTVSVTVADTSGLKTTATGQAVILPAAQPGAAVTGLVTSGSQVVAGAHVYLLAANVTGYGGVGISPSSSNASVSLLNPALSAGSDATGAYVVTGSNSESASRGTTVVRPASSCIYIGRRQRWQRHESCHWNAGHDRQLSSSTAPAIYAIVNEVSTVATAYAFAGFASDATHVSSSGTALAQVGMTNAFAGAAKLETLSTGVVAAGNGYGGVDPYTPQYSGERSGDLYQFKWNGCRASEPHTMLFAVQRYFIGWRHRYPADGNCCGGDQHCPPSERERAGNI